MTGTLQFLLAAHVIAGVAGIILAYSVWMKLLEKGVRIRSAKRLSLVSFVLFLASWISSGYYYTTYYGSAVKPAIKAGPYPWAHAIFMETKEHIFLFLPFMALVLYCCLSKAGDMEEDSVLKKSLAHLAASITILGLFITISGVVISGAVR